MTTDKPCFQVRAVDREIEAMGQGAVRCLVSLHGVDTIDRPAREFFIHSPQYAVALVADSAATRMLANLFLRLKREPTPARTFTGEADAVEWLRAQ